MYVSRSHTFAFFIFMYVIYCIFVKIQAFGTFDSINFTVSQIDLVIVCCIIYKLMGVHNIFVGLYYIMYTVPVIPNLLGAKAHHDPSQLKVQNDCEKCHTHTTWLLS